jgi:hypothetical protein
MNRLHHAATDHAVEEGLPRPAAAARKEGCGTPAGGPLAAAPGGRAAAARGRGPGRDGSTHKGPAADVGYP